MWTVLHTAPRSEAEVCKFLALQGGECYTPQFPPPPRTRPGSVRDRKHRWVFPNYIFFKVPPGFTRWDTIRWAPGVRRLLQEDGRPAIIDDAVVARIQRRLAERTLQPARARFRRGQPVVIEQGPLRMVDAIFDRELDAAARVRILVQIFGRQVAVEVDPADLRAVS